ncbi:MAG: universal stress protein [Gammaproteobacteria bacterium]|nr:universal stress protein [Gammaproteobacteria bacterium]
MKRFKNILFLADHVPIPTRAIGRAIQLAKTNQARLTVLAVGTVPDPSIIDTPAGNSLANALQIDLLAGIDDALMQLDPQDREGITIHSRAELGVPFVVAIQTVAHDRHDLVIKAAERPSGNVERLFGSTDMHLLRKCPCPVWLQPDALGAQYARIVAAIDPLSEPGSEPGSGAALDRTILELATSMAMAEGAELHVVHAWRLADEGLLRRSRGRGLLSHVELDQITERMEARHRAAMNDALTDFRALPVTIHEHLVKGWPNEAILKLARDKRASLIVMGTVGHTRLPGFFIGNTAENVLSESPCGVLAIKPVGFVSPVLAA